MRRFALWIALAALIVGLYASPANAGYYTFNVKDDQGVAQHPPYPEHWYRRIVGERGDHYRVPEKPKAE